MNRKDITDKEIEVRQWISENKPKAFICKELQCRPITLENHLRNWGITYKGNQGKKGSTSPIRKSALEYSKKEFGVQTPKLRKKLIQEGLKKEECESCGISKWLEKQLTLELHHIDGNRFNNNFKNLQLLCPNCHSLTPNHGKRKK
jgi:5-methylcytosine-specific restriction endonuclease McrA